MCTKQYHAYQQDKGIKDWYRFTLCIQLVAKSSYCLSNGKPTEQSDAMNILQYMQLL